MGNPLLSNFELAGQKIDIRDSASYELATAAQQVAETAESKATAAQQVAETAESKATAAQQAAETAESKATAAQQVAETAVSKANAAQQVAETAVSKANAAQQVAETANATAQSAQSTANEIIAGFNTQFVQAIGEYISPYFCKRNNTVYVEFPNIAPNKIINHGSWVTVCHTKNEHKPLSTVYREISVGGTITVLVEISTSGTVKMYSPNTDIQTPAIFFGGFSYLTI